MILSPFAPSRRDFCRRVLGGLSGLAMGLTPQLVPAAVEPPPAEAGVHGFSELRLQAHRLEELRTFYHKQWGLPLVKDKKDTITLKIGKTWLHFTHSAARETKLFYHFAFNVTEHKLDLAKSVSLMPSSRSGRWTCCAPASSMRSRTRPPIASCVKTTPYVS